MFANEAAAYEHLYKLNWIMWCLWNILSKLLHLFYQIHFQNVITPLIGTLNYVLGQLCRHQTVRGQLAQLGKVLTEEHSFRRAHSTGLLSSGLAIGIKDTVSRHVHRELNPQADVPAQELPAAWRAVPPTRSRLSHRLRQQPDYATSLSSLRTKNKLSHQRQTCSLVPHTCSQTSKWAGES